MTSPTEDPRWVDGTLESGADTVATPEGDVPKGATVEPGAESTFEPEEDAT